MPQRNDAVLAVAIAGSMSAGVLFPSVGRLVEPYLLVWLGVLLFLNLIRLSTSDLVTTFARPKSLAVLAAVKLVALPLVMFALTFVVYRPLALPVLLIAGISTGLGAPFVANIVDVGGNSSSISKGRLSLIVGMIIATSLAVPFVLPSLVYAFAGSEFEIPILDMVFLLSAALFIPLAAGWLTKRHAPAASQFADRNSFLLSIIFVVLINLGMFSTLSEYFFSNQVFLLQTIAASFLAFAAFAVIGYAVSPRHERAAGLIAMTYVNNTLVMVFAAQFFGPQVAALAAVYNIPYYVGILVIKKLLAVPASR